MIFWKYRLSAIKSNKAGRAELVQEARRGQQRGIPHIVVVKTDNNVKTWSVTSLKISFYVQMWHMLSFKSMDILKWETLEHFSSGTISPKFAYQIFYNIVLSKELSGTKYFFWAAKSYTIAVSSFLYIVKYLS